MKVGLSDQVVDNRVRTPIASMMAVDILYVVIFKPSIITSFQVTVAINAHIVK